MSGMLPWQARILAKVVLSRIPVGYHLWKRLGLFEHGAMNQPRYALDVVKRHVTMSGVGQQFRGAVALELGPGDSLFSGLVARALGAKITYSVDVGCFATMEMHDYRNMERYLTEQGFSIPDTSAARSIDDLFAAYGVHYMTTGVRSLEQIADSSVDFLWSHATLEHIRRNEFAKLLQHMRRVMRPTAVASHQVDLRDHLGGALNNLRFSDKVWESHFMSRSGFYTNRIGFSEMLELIRRAGFEVEVVEVTRWKDLPTARRAMSSEFRERTLDDLLVQGFHILARPAERPSVTTRKGLEGLSDGGANVSSTA